MVMRMVAMSGRVSSVGVDLDSHCGYSLVRCVVRAYSFGSPRVFYTRNGFHVEVKLFKPISMVKSLDIRCALGDDPDRLAVDEFRVNVSGDCRRLDTLFVGRLKDGEGYTRHEIRVL